MVDREALVISPKWMEDRANQIARAVGHVLVNMDCQAISREDLESDRAGRYVVKLKAVEADGAEVRVEIRVG